MLTIETTQLLDRLAAQTWPAQYTQPLDPWLLRANPALTSRRANSVLAVGDFPKEQNWMKPIKEFYRSHNLPVRFHVSAACPPQLDELLDQWGYTKELETLIMIADLQSILSRSPSSITNPYPVELQGNADCDWISAFMEIEQFDKARTPAYEQMMNRIKNPKSFALTRHPLTNKAAGVGTVVLEGEWAGLINVATSPLFRRQGVALQTVCKLAQWSEEQGAKQMYLQVLANNDVAQRLYSRLGFEKAFGYHYRTAPNDKV